MSKRAHISMETKLAAALLTLGDVPFDHARLMSAKQICSLYHFDHFPIPKAQGGPDEPWNLTPRLIAEHREKTATQDVPTIAKGKRIQKAQAHHAAAVAAKSGAEPQHQEPSRRSRIPSRPFDKGHRPMQSRNDLRRKGDRK